MLAQYRRDLEVQVRSQEVKEAIERIKITNPIFGKFPTVNDLVDLVQPKNRNYADKDKVLGALLKELKRETALFPLLNLMFWENLLRLFHSKGRGFPDREELFSRIQLAFYHTAVTYPLERRPKKIVVNLFLDTKKKVTHWQRTEVLFLIC